MKIVNSCEFSVQCLPAEGRFGVQCLPAEGRFSVQCLPAEGRFGVQCLPAEGRFSVRYSLHYSLFIIPLFFVSFHHDFQHIPHFGGYLF